MRRILFLLAFVVGMASVANAQTEEYVKLIKRQFAVLGTSINADMLKKQIGPIYAKQAGVSLAIAESKVDDYFDTRFIDEMAEIMAPWYENAVSVADYEKYISELEKPEVGEALKKTNAAVKDDTYLSRYVLQMVDPDFKEVESKMTAEFNAVYGKYFEVTDCQTLVDNMLAAIKKALGNDENDIYGKLKKNFYVIMGNEIYANDVTTDELQLLVDVYSMPESKGVKAAIRNMSEDMTAFGLKMVNKILESLK